MNDAITSTTQHLSARKQRAAIISVISNSFLTVSKLVIGLMIGSVSVISEAIHSGVDLVAALIAWTAVRHSDKPADRDHPFGHGKLENVSGAVEALLIFVAAGWILYEAIHKLLAPQPLEDIGPGVVIMAVSALMNWLVSANLFKVGNETDSQALIADAWHLRTDVYTSAGILFGLFAIWGGEKLYPTMDWHWIDPVAAILVAILIIKAAWELTCDAYHALMDSTLPHTELIAIRRAVEEIGSPIVSFHGLRTRKSGAQRFVDFHLSVPADMSVRDSHKIADDLEIRIEKLFPATSVTIHIEPCDEQNCHGECLAECSRRGQANGS
jgi:cation diffusion facilitator family transporter